MFSFEDVAHRFTDDHDRVALKGENYHEITWKFDVMTEKNLENKVKKNITF